MRSSFACAAVSCLSLMACAAAGAAPELKTDQDRTLYALGVFAQKGLESFSLSDAEFEIVKSGFLDGRKGKVALDAEALKPAVQALQTSRVAAAAVKEKAAGQAYVEKAAAAKGAQKTDSGGVVLITKEGEGDAPKPGEKVKVHYEGRLLNGTVFDSSIARKKPAIFPVKDVIPCWTEALQLMKVGGKAEVTCPPEAAYGERGVPGKIPGDATLVFSVELLEIVPATPAK